MDKIKGLEEYVDSEIYRQLMGLPEERIEEYTLLAQGEYNVNYAFEHPVTGKKLLLRVNCGSQMHLERQIEYEARALGLLRASGRTPRVLYVDGSKKRLEYGVLVEERLPGRSLDYHRDMERAAAVLADIHSVKIEEDAGLISPEHSLEAILEECEEMVKTYMESDLADPDKKKKIRELLDMGWEQVRQIEEKAHYRCCINTELNSTNFLIGGVGGCDYLIDWEKPLYGDPAQDLGHFLAPTTTFWKTDVILNKTQMEAFIKEYIHCVDKRYSTRGLKGRTMDFVRITCLRGITWCAMAWVEYQQPDKLITNESTKKKLEQYLDWNFLNKIEGILGQH